MFALFVCRFKNIFGSFVWAFCFTFFSVFFFFTFAFHTHVYMQMHEYVVAQLNCSRFSLCDVWVFPAPFMSAFFSGLLVRPFFTFPVFLLRFWPVLRVSKCLRFYLSIWSALNGPPPSAGEPLEKVSGGCLLRSVFIGQGTPARNVELCEFHMLNILNIFPTEFLAFFITFVTIKVMWKRDTFVVYGFLD